MYGYRMIKTLHDIALQSGACTIGTDQFLFSRAELAEFVRALGVDVGLIELHDRLERLGVPVTLRVG